MESIILYSTGCPQCKILKAKLKEKNVAFNEIDSIEAMLEMGIQSVPVIQINDGELLNFSDAIQWVNLLEGN